MAKKRTSGTEAKVFSANRKARHEYEILETFEAGLVLTGTEIKSIRQHQASLQGSFARIEDGELVLYNMSITPYEQGGRFNVDPVRQRKLLMHRREIRRLAGMVRQQRATLVPLRLYEQRGKAKVELALARGKRVFDKRSKIREREIKRDLDRRVKDERHRRHQ